jgi:hypothetical protein
VIIQPDAETLLAVIMGAVLASAGGFAESHMERVISRRERERSAALMFGELLNTMRLIMALAEEARGRGDPYGPVTLRFLRVVRRETEIYDRNREALFDLRDPRVRSQINYLVARLTFSLEGVADATLELPEAQRALDALAPNDPARPVAEERVKGLQQGRQLAFDFAVQTAGQIDPLLATLSPLAGHVFDTSDSILRAS